MGIREKIRQFLDNIFHPPISILEIAIEKLQNINLVIAQGLNIGKYLSIFGDMPQEWQLVISSLLISVGFLGTLLIFRSVIRIYYSLKEGVKWW
jgi:hypothetical protein